MATCKDCLHFDVCEALESGNGIPKLHPLQCGCFKSQSNIVEVVRCKGCKNYVANYCCRDIKGRTNMFFMNENDFCSYGKRKDGAGE